MIASEEDAGHNNIENIIDEMSRIMVKRHRQC
jgi:hypothetical protein